MRATSDVPGLDGHVREYIYSHVFGNADREVGGVLVGRIARQGAIPLVTAAIAAANAGERRSTLTFTQDTWEHVHRVLEAQHPNDQIVGWYHSHPGFGIFLSEHDLFIHRNFFSGTSQIALVVDPLNGTEGLFGWEDNQVAKWVESPTGRPGLGPATPSPPDAPYATMTAAGGAVAMPTAVDRYTVTASRGVGPPPSESSTFVPAAAVGVAPSRTQIVVDEPRAVARQPASPIYLLGALLLGVIIGLALWEAVLRDDGGRSDSSPTRVTIPTPRQHDVRR